MIASQAHLNTKMANRQLLFSALLCLVIAGVGGQSPASSPNAAPTPPTTTSPPPSPPPVAPAPAPSKTTSPAPSPELTSPPAPPTGSPAPNVQPISPAPSAAGQSGASTPTISSWHKISCSFILGWALFYFIH